MIVLKIGALFSPMRLFLPISFIFFLVGFVNHLYTYIVFSSLSQGSFLMYTAAIFTFLMGVLSEQVSSLHYRHTDKE